MAKSSKIGAGQFRRSQLPKAGRDSTAVRVRVTKEEQDEIRLRALSLGLSVSAYLRIMALLPQTTLDDLQLDSYDARFLLIDDQAWRDIRNSINTIAQCFVDISLSMYELSKNPHQGREQERAQIAKQTESLRKIEEKVEDVYDQLADIQKDASVRRGL